MTTFLPGSWEQALPVALVFFRLLGLFLLAPGMSNPAIPSTAKGVLLIGLSWALFPVVRPHLPALSASLGSLTLSVIREMAIGAIMGLVSYITFEAVQLAAHFVGYQMGLGTTSLMDPQNQSQVSTLVPIHSWMALMLFFGLDLHHGILIAFVKSYEVTRLLSWEALGDTQALRHVVFGSSKLFFAAVQMAAPVTFLVLCCNIALGVLAKILPQMNVLLFSFPITLAVGLVGLYVFAPQTVSFIEGWVAGSVDEVVELLRVF